MLVSIWTKNNENGDQLEQQTALCCFRSGHQSANHIPAVTSLTLLTRLIEAEFDCAYVHT